MNRVIVVLIVAVACGSSHRVGDSCGMMTESGGCEDAHTRLVCENGHYIAEPCRGPAGCREEEQPSQGALSFNRVLCDVSENRDGDRCARSISSSGKLRIGGEEGQGACGSDRRSILVCHDGRYERHACAGSAGCYVKGDKIGCDGPMP